MRNFAILAALAAGGVLASIGAASANDTVRLGGPSAEAAIQGGTNTELVRGYGGYRGGHGHYHGGYGHGHYRGGYGHYHGGYGHGHYRGGYGYGYGYYRPYFYAGYYGSYYPYYSSSYYAPYYYYSSYTPGYYYAAPYAYSYGVNGEEVAPPATTVPGTYSPPAPKQFKTPPMPPAPGDGTFLYDGGPRSPVPMPNATEPRPIPVDGKLVSLPTQITGGTSRVGEITTTQPSAPRVEYPAYGDEPITPAPRKTSR